MKTLCYMRYERGCELETEIHADYEDKDESAFFEQSRNGISTKERLNALMESYKTLLPHTKTIMYFRERASEGSRDRDIHVYLWSLKVSGVYRTSVHVCCAFATFERLDIKSKVLHDTFNTIANGGDGLAHLVGRPESNRFLL